MYLPLIWIKAINLTINYSFLSGLPKNEKFSRHCIQTFLYCILKLDSVFAVNCIVYMYTWLITRLCFTDSFTILSSCGINNPQTHKRLQTKNYKTNNKKNHLFFVSSIDWNQTGKNQLNRKIIINLKNLKTILIFGTNHESTQQNRADRRWKKPMADEQFGV